MTGSVASVTPDLIRYMAKAAATPVPPQVLAKAKHHVLDTVAAMVSGTTIKPGEFALRYVHWRTLFVGLGLLTYAVAVWLWVCVASLVAMIFTAFPELAVLSSAASR